MIVNRITKDLLPSGADYLLHVHDYEVNDSRSYYWKWCEERTYKEWAPGQRAPDADVIALPDRMPNRKASAPASSSPKKTVATPLAPPNETRCWGFLPQTRKGSEPVSSSTRRGVSRDRSGVTPSVAVTSAGRRPEEKSAEDGTRPGAASPQLPDHLARCALKDVPAVTLVVSPMIQPTVDNLLCRAEREGIGTQF